MQHAVYANATGVARAQHSCQVWRLVAAYLIAELELLVNRLITHHMCMVASLNLRFTYRFAHIGCAGHYGTFGLLPRILSLKLLSLEAASAVGPFTFSLTKSSCRSAYKTTSLIQAAQHTVTLLLSGAHCLHLHPCGLMATLLMQH